MGVFRLIFPLIPISKVCFQTSQSEIKPDQKSNFIRFVFFCHQEKTLGGPKEVFRDEEPTKNRIKERTGGPLKCKVIKERTKG